MAENARVTVVCALAAEARCLIEHWRLPVLRERPFALYGDVDTRVVISGVGSHAAAAAVGFAAGVREARDDDVWLNFGIAGHGHLALGTPLLAARVSHHGRDGAWYPSLLFTPPCAVAELITHASVVTDYDQRACCDMEAAGFLDAVMRIAGGDLVQVLKVVSDNAASGITGIDRTRIQRLMHAALPVVLALIASLRELAAHLPQALDESPLAPFLTSWHFTHAQTAQLRQLWARLTVLEPTVALAQNSYADCRDAAAVLARLRARVDGLPLPQALTC